MYYTDSNRFYNLQLPWTKPVFFPTRFAGLLTSNKKPVAQLAGFSKNRKTPKIPKISLNANLSNPSTRGPRAYEGVELL